MLEYALEIYVLPQQLNESKFKIPFPHCYALGI